MRDAERIRENPLALPRTRNENLASVHVNILLDKEESHLVTVPIISLFNLSVI